MWHEFQNNGGSSNEEYPIFIAGVPNFLNTFAVFPYIKKVLHSYRINSWRKVELHVSIKQLHYSEIFSSYLVYLLPFHKHTVSHTGI